VPLAAAPDLGPCKATLIDPTTLEVEVQRAHSLNTVFELLGARGIQVTSMRNKSNRLEELFVKLTGDGGGAR
jgi:ABC-2 type transport system ATP-binding protein